LDQPVRYEKEYLRKDGSQVPIELLTHIVREPDGTPAFYNAFITDITERRHAQREMLKTDKLESLGVLAGGIAHDFNNILTAILGNISLAQMYVNDPEALMKRLEDAEHAALRAKGLPRQLLTFARGGEPVKKFVQIRKLLEEAAGFATVGSIITRSGRSSPAGMRKIRSWQISGSTVFPPCSASPITYRNSVPCYGRCCRRIVTSKPVKKMKVKNDGLASP
jgi:hypothetical protein